MTPGRTSSCLFTLTDCQPAEHEQCQAQSWASIEGICPPCWIQHGLTPPRCWQTSSCQGVTNRGECTWSAIMTDVDSHHPADGQHICITHYTALHQRSALLKPKLRQQGLTCWGSRLGEQPEPEASKQPAQAWAAWHAACWGLQGCWGAAFRWHLQLPAPAQCKWLGSLW